MVTGVVGKTRLLLLKILLTPPRLLIPIRQPLVVPVPGPHEAFLVPHARRILVPVVAVPDQLGQPGVLREGPPGELVQDLAQVRRVPDVGVDDECDLGDLGIFDVTPSFSGGSSVGRRPSRGFIGKRPETDDAAGLVGVGAEEKHGLARQPALHLVLGVVEFVVGLVAPLVPELGL